MFEKRNKSNALPPAISYLLPNNYHAMELDPREQFLVLWYLIPEPYFQTNGIDPKGQKAQIIFTLPLDTFMFRRS